MNRIILIGNGFDLAHGLKTSYKDFIDDFWKREIEKIKEVSHLKEYDDESITLSVSVQTLAHIVDNGSKIETLSELKREIKAFTDELSPNPNYYDPVSFTIKNKFLEYITNEVTLQNWVDIEDVYHKFLNAIRDIRLRSQLNIRVNEFYYTSVKDLHKDFDAIKKLLEEYLFRVIKEMPSVIKGVNAIIYSPIELKDLCSQGLKVIEEDITAKIGYDPFYVKKEIQSVGMGLSAKELDKGYLENERKKEKLKYFKGKIKSRTLSTSEFDSDPNQILFLNFNYTPVEKHYATDENEVIHIHGELKNTKNPIIFGYGDELCEEYKALEKLNKNEYLENIKSIKYLETNNYKSLLSFIDSEAYQIFIFGHSCGNSDRTLLNTLFEHDNCVSIKLFYYKDEEKGKDYYSDVVRNISRNFNDKKSLREKVVNKEISQTLPQLPKVEVKK